MFSPEFELLLLACRLGQPGALIEAQKIIDSKLINWGELYRWAEIHCIKPQLAMLTGNISSDRIPAAFKDGLDEAYRDNLVNQIRYAEEFFRIRDLLAGYGIRMLPFKGFWLAYEAYGNIADRESLDVDVFVNEADLARIRDLMQEAGYQEEDVYRQLSIAEIKKGFQEYNFDRVEAGNNIFHIEFHWGICPPEYEMAVRLEDLSGQTTSGKFQGRDLEVFTPSAQLLLTVLHHGGKDRYNQLKQVNDIAQTVKNCEGIDWVWLLSEAGRFNAERLVYIGLELAASVTGIEVPQEMKSLVATRRIRRLAGNRLRLMNRSPDIWYNARFNFINWLFRIRTRSGLKTKIRLTAATARAVFFKKGPLAK